MTLAAGARRSRTLGRVQQLRISADAVVKRRNGGVLARGWVADMAYHDEV